MTCEGSTLDTFYRVGSNQFEGMDFFEEDGISTEMTYYANLQSPTLFNGYFEADFETEGTACSFSNTFTANLITPAEDSACNTGTDCNFDFTAEQLDPGLVSTTGPNLAYTAIYPVVAMAQFFPGDTFFPEDQPWGKYIPGDIFFPGDTFFPEDFPFTKVNEGDTFFPGDTFVLGGLDVALNYFTIGADIDPAFIPGKPSVCLSKVYIIDPIKNQQTLWPNVICTQDGLFISTEETGVFVIYLFLSAEDALNAPAVITTP